MSGNAKQRRKRRRASTVVVVAVDNEAKTITLEKLGPRNAELRRRERENLKAMQAAPWANGTWEPGVWRDDAFFPHAFKPLDTP